MDSTRQIQIDHMVIDARHMSDLLDVRSYRGAKVDSYHYLVIARMTAGISHIKKTKRREDKEILYTQITR
jgi:hypothetical protein